MKNLQPLLVAALIIISICLIWYNGYFHGHMRGITTFRSHIISHDTIYKDTLIQFKRDTLYLTKWKPITTTKTDTITKIVEKEKAYPYYNTTVNDTISTDSTTVSVGMNVTSRDTTTTISSLNINLLKYPTYREVIEVNKTTKHKPIQFGIQTGVGYGITTKKPDVYIGIGLQYNLKLW